MTPEERQFELKKRRITQKSIAEEAKRCEFHISEVIRGRRVSDFVMKLISSKIGRDHREVFSEYYLKRNKRQRKSS